ncbi:MAG TPA: hypothetical protein IAB49_01225 [Candidatus Caccenecus avistercoris]|nr:hypothetical protein [Candidatus Caccenecus avistercoris]
MKSDAKIIIIGTAITLVVLILAIFLFYIFSTNYAKNKIVNENNNNSASDIENDVNTNKKVTLYLFRGLGCPHCEDAIEFLESIIDDYPYLEVQTLEVWRNKNNKKLMDIVSKKLDIEVSSSVPLIIIGDEYARRGFADGMENTIKNQIEKAYQSALYKDIVAEVLENNPDIQIHTEILSKN